MTEDSIRLLLERGVVTPAQVEECRKAAGPDGEAAAVLAQLRARGYVGLDAIAGLVNGTEDGGTTNFAAADRAQGPAAEALETWAGPGGKVDPAPACAEMQPRGSQGGTAAGRYGLIECLGAGGMGVVWKVHDRELDRVVALKQLRPSAAGDEEAKQRFLREARLAARLRHPNILPVYDVGSDAEGPYLTMQYIDGPTLGDRFHESCEPPRAGAADAGDRLREDIGLLTAVCEAVAHAHREGIVHRDLKPGNVLLDVEGRPQVADFGLAKEVYAGAVRGDARAGRLLDLTVDGQVLGTPAYMPPEQVEGTLEAIGPRSDVWALGVMLYERLTGKLPFGSTADMSTLWRILHEEVRPPGDLDPGVPSDLGAICMKAVQRTLAERYADAGEMAADLGRWLRGEPVRARPPRAMAGVRRWIGRHRAAVLGGVVAICVAALAVAWGWSAQMRSHTRTRLAVDRIGRSVEELSDAIRRTPLTPEARAALARQSLEFIQELVQDDPKYGPAYSWRGMLHQALGQGREASEDHDRGCALSPDQAVVWYLRGMHHVDRYADSRPLPRVDVMPGGIEFESPPAETSRQRELRDRGLSDLAQMMMAADQGTGMSGERLRTARAMVAAHSGTETGFVDALELLEGLEGSRATWLRALSLYHLKRFEEAADAYRRVQELWPEYVPALEQAGNAFYALGLLRRVSKGDVAESFREAIRAFGAAIERAPNNLEALTGRGNSRKRLAHEIHERGDDASDLMREAIVDFTRCIELRPDRFEALVNRGIIHAELAGQQAARGQDPTAGVRAALADFDAGLLLEPSHFGILTNRGAALDTLANWETKRGGDPRAILRDAIRCYSEAMEKNPHHVIAYNNRGNSYLSLADVERSRGEESAGNYERAIQDLEEALRRSPGYLEAHNNLALAWIGEAKNRGSRGEDLYPSIRAAIATCDRALERTRSLPWLYSTRASAYHLLARAQEQSGTDSSESYRKALEDYASSLNLRPNHAPAHLNRGLIHRDIATAKRKRGADACEELQRAIDEFSGAIRCHPGYLKAFLNRGITRNWLGAEKVRRRQDPRSEFRGAVEDLDEVLRLNPRLTNARYQRGIAHLNLALADRVTGADSGANDRAAQADLRAAADQGESDALLPLGDLYRRLGRAGDAEAAYREAARANPALSSQSQARIAALHHPVAAADSDAVPSPWTESCARAREAFAAGNFSSARAEFERGLSLLDEELAPLTEQERTARMADPTLREQMLTANHLLARLLSLASVGRDRPTSHGGGADREVSPEEAARLRDRAFRHLEAAIDLGGRELAQGAGDPDLAPLRADPRWSRAIGRMAEAGQESPREED